MTLINNLSMVKNQSLFQNKLFQATLMVSIILISSAIFMSQTDKMFGKAATPITGHMVLFEAGPGASNAFGTAIGDQNGHSVTREAIYNTNIYDEILFVPGVDCQFYGKCCYSGRYFQSSVNIWTSTNSFNYGSCIDATFDYTNKAQYEYAVSCTVPGALNHVSVSYKC